MAEASKLLPDASSNVASSTTYDSVDRDDRSLNDSGESFRLESSEDDNPRSRITSVLFVSFPILAVTLFFSFRGNFMDGSPTFSQQLVVSELIFAPSVADETTSFCKLAQYMLPAWYQESVSNLPVFVPDVQPGDIYNTRKVLLKTRDLVDVFSPVYPNVATTSTNNETTINEDMWSLIRHHLNVGYMVVGEFQDLHNAHVLYSQELMEQRRNVVLKWKSDFEQFQATHDALLFLQSPTTGSHQHKESHLFWQNAAALPSGSDSATSSLQMLGKLQLHQVLEYLWQAFPYVSVLEEGAHQHYHNLRKQLRSVVDEYELFGNVMYPETEQVASAMAVLTRARTRLGNINDDWTAYSIYVENGEYYSEQQRLEIKIDESWTKFRVWVHKVKFEDVIQYLVSSLNRVPQAVHKTLCLNQFLQDRKQRPTRHLVIGNEAGDADSIISAITLAYVESSQEEIESTPIVSIPKADLTTQRPEVSLLMEMAGIVNASSNLIFVDDPLIQHDSIDSKATLVDHNILAEKFQGKNWTVVEIVDHHQDEGLYFETCSGNDRTIAFVNDKALVASACTLVAERLRKVWKPPYPVSIAVLLLGVILLDSVNLSPEVGKVTQRDKDAIDDLLVNTEWQDLHADARLTIGMGTGDPVPNSTILFNVLQGAKYDKDFWKSLSVRDALRYDYKEYSSCGQTFGVSTVLMPLRPFFGKDTVTTGILDYMKAMNVAFLGIMFASIDNKGHLFRQLAFCATNGFSMKDLGEFLHESDYYHGLLDLKEIQDSFLSRDNQGLSLQFFDQRNVQPSRKQIGPALEEFFQYISKSTCNTDQDLADS